MCAEGRVTKGGVIVFFRGNNKHDCIKNNECLINNFLEVSLTNSLQAESCLKHLLMHKTELTQQ
jgi:hypothetical protein